MNEEAHELLGRIDAKVDILLVRSEKQDRRLNIVEKRQYVSAGVISACVALVLPHIKAFLGFS